MPNAAFQYCRRKLFSKMNFSHHLFQLRDHVDWITATTKMGALAAEQAEKLAQKTHGARGTNDDRLIKMPRQSADEARECGPEVISLWNLEDGGNCTNSMTISSPGYPGWYPANADCPVQIQAPENTRVFYRQNSKKTFIKARTLLTGFTLSGACATRRKVRR
jgi:hypothetical protein